MHERATVPECLSVGLCVVTRIHEHVTSPRRLVCRRYHPLHLLVVLPGPFNARKQVLKVVPRGNEVHPGAQHSLEELAEGGVLANHELV